MALRLILGRAGSGKSRLCLREIAGELLQKPRGFPLIYIVPEQATFQAEYDLATYPGLGGTMRAQVLSFRRLAWRVLQETGGGRLLFIDDTGKSMLLRKVMEQDKDKLKVFRHSAEQAGGLESLLQFFNELKRSGITLEQLKNTINRQAAGKIVLPPFFLEKTEDIILLFNRLDEELKGHYLDGEDYLALLALFASRSTFLQEAEVWVDAFYGFTGQEYQVLEELLKKCRRVNVALCLDKDYPGGVAVSELDPFYPPAICCQKLKLLAEKNSQTVEKVLLPPGDKLRFGESPALAFLEQKLFTYPAEPFRLSPLLPLLEAFPIHLAASPNRRSEIEAIARKMIIFARDHDYRWRDMAVITAGLDVYRDIISTVFPAYSIPFFLDQKRPVIHHPLVEFIRSVLEVVNGGWRSDAVFRCAKTDFLLPLSSRQSNLRRWREWVDLLENYVLAYGLQGKHFTTEAPWTSLKKDSLEEENKEEEQFLSPYQENYLKLINKVRQKICAPLRRFQQNMASSATAGEKTQALFQLLQQVKVEERLEQWMKEAAGKGHAEKVREHDQVYDGVLNLLEQLMELLGEETISNRLYGQVIEAGLEQLRLSLVPPALDQVLLGDVERSRPGRVKAVFLIGVNDGILPSRPPRNGPFTEEERELLLKWNLEISPAGLRRLLDEQFLIYTVLSRPSSKLHISYPLADEEGRALAPSLLISRIKELFPDLQEELLTASPQTQGESSTVFSHPTGTQGDGSSPTQGDGSTVFSHPTGTQGDGFSLFSPSPAGATPKPGHKEEISPAGSATENRDLSLAELNRQLLHYLVHPRITLSHLVLQLGAWKKGSNLPPAWWEIYNWYTTPGPFQEEARHLLRSLFYQNQEFPLGPEGGRALYGTKLQASVSRLERFQACPFAHYIAYGLRLKERPVYRLESPDIGRFYHAVLRNTALALEQDETLDWEDLDRSLARQLVEKEVEELAPHLQKEILFSSSRYRYLAGRLTDTAGRSLYYLGEHARGGMFRPVGLELPFGAKEAGAEGTGLVYSKTKKETEAIEETEEIEETKTKEETETKGKMEITKATGIKIEVGTTARGIKEGRAEVLAATTGIEPGAGDFKESVVEGQKSRFVALERGDQSRSGLKGLVLPLPAGSLVELAGRIDRVDLARDRIGRYFIRIVDYKSGSTSFNLADVYHGLSLQMLLYLDVVLSQLPSWLQVEAHPAGILYFPVHAPLLHMKTPPPPEEIEQKMLQAYKMKGKVLKDPAVLKLMDKNLEQGYSSLIPVGITKKGEFYSRSHVLSLEQFQLLQSFARELLQKAGAAILEGQVKISPYRLGKKNACTFCPYSPVCQFDLLLEENCYRQLKTGSEAEILSWITQLSQSGLKG